MQDALGYRTDQNAPFNPTYSLAERRRFRSFRSRQSAPVPAAAKLVPGGVQPNLRTPTLISWSFRIQQEITANTALTVGYVGSHGYHESSAWMRTSRSRSICPAAPCPAVYPSELPGRLSRHAGSGWNLLRPDSHQSRNAAWPTPGPIFPRATASYNALQVDVNHRFSRGFSLRGVYTWSKTIDDGDSLNATTSGGEPALASNPFNLRADRGLANFDVRNAAAISGLLSNFRIRAREYGWLAGWMA